MSNQHKQCKATNKDGSPCKAEAREDGLCYFHHPENQALLAKARRKGGYNRRRPREHTETPRERLRSVEDVLAVVEASVADAFKLEASERRCRTIGYLCGVALRGLEVAKIEELERRLTALENARAAA